MRPHGFRKMSKPVCRIVKISFREFIIRYQNRLSLAEAPVKDVHTFIQGKPMQNKRKQDRSACRGFRCARIKTNVFYSPVAAAYIDGTPQARVKISHFRPLRHAIRP